MAREQLVGELLDLATSTAASAGPILLAGLHRARLEVSTKTSPTDVVTEMDRASEAHCVAAISAARPDDGFLGEEGAAAPARSGVRWIIDPIDGTTNYLYALPGFAVSIAAELDGVVVAGAVFDVVHGELFTASENGAALCNGEPIAPSSKDELATALIGTGFSYERERRGRQAQVLTTVLPAVRDIRRGGAASIDLCWVACGRLDGFYEKGLSLWDYAAASLIAERAGARTGNLDGGTLSTQFALATSASLFDALRDLLHLAGAGTA